MRVLIAGGGTGGHVMPALAIGGELRDRYRAEVRFVGTARGLETRLIPEAGFPLELIQVGQLKNVSLGTRAKTLADLPIGVRRCMKLIRGLRPHVVIGVGGYASGPAMMAAVLLRVPTLVYEPNAVPGLANRIVGRWVNAAAVNFEESRRFFRNPVVTGVPVRSEFFHLPPKAGGAPRLLVTGGSQGARVFNAMLPTVAKSLLDAVPGLSILHQTGANRELEVRERYRESGADLDRWDTCQFFGDMAEQFGRADLVLCRSGATTVAELAAAAKPSLLVPFPQAADDHQRKNAEVLLRSGAAAMLLEAEMTPERLEADLIRILRDGDSLIRMAAAARSQAHPEALQRMGEMVAELAGR